MNIAHSSNKRKIHHQTYYNTNIFKRYKYNKIILKRRRKSSLIQDIETFKKFKPNNDDKMDTSPDTEFEVNKYICVYLSCYIANLYKYIHLYYFF